jgi:hypothetical protein
VEWRKRATRARIIHETLIRVGQRARHKPEAMQPPQEALACEITPPSDREFS